MNEFETKQSRIHALLAERDLDALLLQRASSFAWATCGANSAVNMASTNGAAALLITPTERHLVTDNLEAARLEEEERLGAGGQEWTFHVRPWYERDEALARLVRGRRLGADGPYPGATDLSADLARLRSRLTPQEGERMQALGAEAAAAVALTAAHIRRGQTEQAISARLSFEAELLGIQPITNIVATDERISRYRHALPTDKLLDRYAMLVLNGRRRGLVCTVTRFVHFGPLPEALRQAHETAARIAALCIEATRPGVPLGDVFALAMREYASAGMPDAWREHHQGGAVGYEPREFLVTPGMAETVVPGQAFVWNPSVGAARSVDTFLVGEAEHVIVTRSPAWPSVAVPIGDRLHLRPAVLVV